MRIAIIAVWLLPLAVSGCGKEPAFDDRYDAAAKEIEARAKAMDADIAEAERAAGAADNSALPAARTPSRPASSSGE